MNTKARFVIAVIAGLSVFGIFQAMGSYGFQQPSAETQAEVVEAFTP